LRKEKKNPARSSVGEEEVLEEVADGGTSAIEGADVIRLILWGAK